MQCKGYNINGDRCSRVFWVKGCCRKCRDHCTCNKTKPSYSLEFTSLYPSIITDNVYFINSPDKKIIINEALERIVIDSLPDPTIDSEESEDLLSQDSFIEEDEIEDPDAEYFPSGSESEEDFLPLKKRRKL